MIIKMKKVSLVLPTKTKEIALKSLENAEVLHVGTINSTNDKINDINLKLSIVNQAISMLPKVKNTADTKANPEELVDEIITLGNQTKSLDADIISYSRELDRISTWGDFNPQDIIEIKKQGYFVKLYELDNKDYEKLETDIYVCKLSSNNKKVQFATISKTDHSLEIENEFDIPIRSLSKLKIEIEEKKGLISINNEKLIKLAEKLPVLIKYKNVLLSKLEFETTLESMDNYDELSVLSGYIPISKLENFKNLVKQEKWAALYTDPTNEEINSVPTLTEQKGVGKLIDPILKMFDLIPGYKEFDISLVMFFFFTIFFSMIIADAAYGLIFLVVGVTFAIKQKMSGECVSPLIWAFIWLSSCTVVWGALNGVWLGLEYIEHQPFFVSLVIEKLKDPIFFQKLTFMIGVAHLSIARLWSIFRMIKINIYKSVAGLGSLAMLISMYYVVLFLLLGASTLTKMELPNGQLPNWVFPMILIGFLMVVFFHEQKPGQNFFKGILLGFANIFPTFLESVENFSNIISYIRLYAVSLAGLAIAEAFNGMALSKPWYIAIFIMLAAHTLNMVLALLGVVVHGLRLNSLEFSNHLGLTWSGTTYKPFGSKRF